MHVLVALILFVYGARALATFDDDDLITYKTVSFVRYSRKHVQALTKDLATKTPGIEMENHRP